MKVIEENNTQIVLKSDMAFIYSADSSEVLYLEDIENKDEPLSIIKRELELKSRGSLPLNSFEF